MVGDRAVCLIRNPHAGSAGEIRRVLDALERHGPVEVLETRERGDGVVRAEDALGAGFRRIVVAGGDGTVNEVVNGIAPDFGEVELAVVPFGTGNDFARTVGVGPDDGDAIAALEAWRTRPVDVVRARSGETVRYLLNSSSGGFSTAVGKALSHEDKEAWGALAYMISAAKAIPDLRAHRVRLTVDGEELRRDDCLNVVIANGGSLGGGIRVAPGARVDDGAVEVVVIPDVSIVQLGVLVSKLMAGDPDIQEQLITRRGSRVLLEAEPELVMNADGEALGPTPVEYEVLPRALRFVVGAGE